jgi:hypothetical protein
MIRITIDDKDATEIFFHLVEQVREANQRLIEIGHRLDKILRKEQTIMANIDQVLEDIANEKTLIGSVGQVLQTLRDQLTAQGVEQEKIDKAFAGLEENKQALADALVAGTPSAPATGGSETPAT